MKRRDGSAVSPIGETQEPSPCFIFRLIAPAGFGWIAQCYRVLLQFGKARTG